jgi:nicotine blue oxidoreductase
VIPAVVLAAGAGTRYGGPKQRDFLPRVLERLRAGGVSEIVVVAGAYQLDVDATVVECPDWERGPGASLRCGLAALPPAVTHALVVLADGPGLDPRAVERVAAHSGDAEVVAASYGGVRGHPVSLARSVWASVPDAGARELEPSLLPCDDLDPPGDVDYRDPPSGS